MTIGDLKFCDQDALVEEYIEQVKPDSRWIYPLFTLSLILSVIISFFSAYFLTSLFFYKDKKERQDKEIHDERRQRVTKKECDSSSAPRKLNSK